MSGMQKPFANEGPKPTPASTPPQQSKEPQQPPAKKGGIVGKFVKFVLLVAIVGSVASMAIHGKRVGEARSEKANPLMPPADAHAQAKFAGPWEWTSEEWDGWKSMVMVAGEKVTSTVSAKSAALQARVEQWRKSGSGTAASTTPATVAGSNQPLSPDAAKAHRLVLEGSQLWEKHELDAAKSKLDEATTIMKALPEKDRAHPTMVEDQKLAHDLLEDIEAR